MKPDKILEELYALAKSLGYSVHREPGAFKGGACIVREQKHIIINKSMPLEASSVILARALCQLDVEGMFIKPAVREIIDRERKWALLNPDVMFELDGAKEVQE
ncbi:MAG: hypothetical protein HQ472_05300 [Ignavibacteria bacterium]|nr:hypothetical protein [Ignavibacteria bacterium]